MGFLRGLSESRGRLPRRARGCLTSTPLADRQAAVERTLKRHEAEAAALAAKEKAEMDASWRQYFEKDWAKEAAEA
ncbi:hypothetical protein KR52_11565 [Synechococcus sp. KORDI-52]|nr:hypothetical protein KR52_11565 [Synechococcus sp. KORDI-52]